MVTPYIAYQSNRWIIIVIIQIAISIATLLMMCLTGMLSSKDLYLCDITEEQK